MKQSFLYILILCGLIGNAQTGIIKAGADGKIVDMRGTKLKYQDRPGFTTADSLTMADKKYVDFKFSTVSGGSGTNKQIEYTFTNTGDSTLQSDSLIGASIFVYRNGDKVSASGYVFNSGTGTITLRPYVQVGEVVQIEYGNYNTYIVGSALYYLNFTTRSPAALSMNTSTHVLSGGDDCTSYGNYALANANIPGGQDGYIEFQYLGAGTDNDNCILAFNTSNTNEKEVVASTHNYEAGMIINGGTLSYFNNHSAVNPVGGAAIPTNGWVRIQRTGGVVKLRSSPDRVTYTDRFTFTDVSGLSTNTLYVNANIPCFTNLVNAQIFY